MTGLLQYALIPISGLTGDFMVLKHLTLGDLGTNCYVLCDEATKEGAVIDPAVYSIEIEKAIIEAGIKSLKYIICTHGHFDHVGGVCELSRKHPQAKIVAGKDEATLLRSPMLNLSGHFGYPFEMFDADLSVEGGDRLALGENDFRVYSTPGHTKGGIVLVCENAEMIFSGDTLFMGSIGRTDFPGGSYSELMNSLNLFKRMPKSYKIYSGHGPATTVGYELKANMYLK